MNATEFDRAILLNWRHCGQARAYADTIYDAELTFTGRNISTRPEKTTLVCGCHPGEDRVKQIARLLVANWVDKPDGLDPRLEICECVEKTAGASRWRVRIVQPFLD